ncbi:hypothetical protein GCM10009527_077570 [Actinomadura nitritigenes]
MFCGDAVADPLTGLTAALLAATAPPGRGVLWDVSMSAAVAATLDPGPPVPGVPALRGGGGWAVETAAGLVPVASPEHREPDGDAPAAGADTADVLRGLGSRSREAMGVAAARPVRAAAGRRTRRLGCGAPRGRTR